MRFESISVNVGGSGVIPNQEVIYVRAPSGSTLVLQPSSCPVCGFIILAIPTLISPDKDQRAGPGIVYPYGATRPVPSEVKTADSAVAADFSEAVAVLPHSRKASAALSRRCLQHVLSTVGGAKKRDLADQIDEVLPNLPQQIGHNVDAIRHVGNFAAHPLKSTNTGQIVDVEDGEAEWLLDVLEDLFEFYYVAPAKATARRVALNKKLADIGKPPLKKP